MESRESSATPLERLGIYRVQSLLGRGGMGEVYLAWDELLERHVAIKRVLGERLDSLQRTRFLREARAVARLDHPAIVRIYHVLERDDGDCLVMEHVRGQDLSKWRRSVEPDPTRIAAIGRDVAEGLAHAHAHGLVHRDLKPANVMVTAEDRVKILDFGLAKAFGPTEGRHLEVQEAEVQEAEVQKAEDPEALTGSGMLVGTAHAMSPEQARSEPVDHRSDLFALGSLLYELLSGRSPFRGNGLVDTLRRVVVEDPEPIERGVPDVPGELAALIHELLEKDPADRPPSARRVAERLDAVASGAVAGARRNASDLALPATAADPNQSTAERPSPLPRPAPRATVRTLARVLGPPEPRSRTLPRLVTRFDGEPAPGADSLYLFHRAADAVGFALALHRELRLEPDLPAARVGLHLGEVTVSPSGIEGDALARVERLAGQAREHQTLLDRGAFDLARAAGAPDGRSSDDDTGDGAVRWLAHGPYLFDGLDEPLDVFEVGVEGFAPLSEPTSGHGVRRAISPTEEVALGRRPAVGEGVPRRPSWRLVERLGEGGFGEVWLARHKSGEERVFKFCFEPERLRALKREVTLFRLLRESLGHRRDIARVLDWDFDEVPYFLESEYTEGGDLARWAERRGGLASVPLTTRLELIAQVADALAAAHSVGVLHKDVKPGNVLVSHDADGRPRALLTDFGIGLLTEKARLEQPGFTVLGFTETTLDHGSSTPGTVRYMAPELLEGKPATVQADVYALGVVLYQAVTGDFERALAPGWRREIEDPLLLEDVAACVDGAPERRLRGPAELAERLRALERRHAERRAEQEADAARERARRRRRLAGRLGAFAVVLLLAVSIFAVQTYRAKNRELEARQQAEQRRRQAEDLIDFLLGDLRAELQPIGKLAVLDQVGDQAMDYFAAVPEDQLSDEEIAHYAKALHQIGQVRFELGKVPEATEAFEASLERAKRLAARDPENTDWQFQLGQSHFWVGFLRWRLRDLETALEQFEAYRRVSEELAERYPEQKDRQIELAYSHSNVGQILDEQGASGDAIRSLETSVEIFETLTSREPNPTLEVELAHVRAKLGEALRNRGRLERSAVEFRSALETYQRAAQGEAAPVERWADISTLHEYLGEVLLYLGNPAEAEGHFRSGLETARRLVEHDPKSAFWKEVLVRRLNRLARALLSAGRLDLAGELTAEERAVVESQVRAAPDHPYWKFARARSFCARASLQSVEGSLQEAFASAQACRAGLERLLEREEAREYRLWLARAHELLGSIHVRWNDEARSSASWQEGIRVVEPLSLRSPRPREIALLVRLSILADLAEEAAPWMAELENMGYHDPSYLAFLDDEASPGVDLTPPSR